MRRPIVALAGLFLSATLVGCGGTTMPAAPSNAKDGPPPGSSNDMTNAKGKAKTSAVGGTGPAAPAKKK